MRIDIRAGAEHACGCVYVFLPVVYVHVSVAVQRAALRKGYYWLALRSKYTDRREAANKQPCCRMDFVAINTIKSAQASRIALAGGHRRIPLHKQQTCVSANHAMYMHPHRKTSSGCRARKKNANKRKCRRLESHRVCV